VRDRIVVAVLVGAFATLVTAHLTTVARLGARRPRWRAPLALVLPPLAPYWAARAGLRAEAALWAASAAVYAVALVLASR
jgi:hypothetical protein